MTKIKWIKWVGMNTSKTAVYRVEEESYEKLYNRIQEKYGYGKVIHEDALWLYLAEKLELADEVELTFGSMNIEKFFNIFEEMDYHITEDDYKNAIYESRSQAYYQTFEEEF